MPMTPKTLYTQYKALPDEMRKRIRDSLVEQGISIKGRSLESILQNLGSSQENAKRTIKNNIVNQININTDIVAINTTIQQIIQAKFTDPKSLEKQLFNQLNILLTKYNNINWSNYIISSFKNIQQPLQTCLRTKSHKLTEEGKTVIQSIIDNQSVSPTQAIRNIQTAIQQYNEPKPIEAEKKVIHPTNHQRELDLFKAMIARITTPQKLIDFIKENQSHTPYKLSELCAIQPEYEELLKIKVRQFIVRGRENLPQDFYETITEFKEKVEATRNRSASHQINHKIDYNKQSAPIDSFIEFIQKNESQGQTFTRVCAENAKTRAHVAQKIAEFVTSYENLPNNFYSVVLKFQKDVDTLKNQSSREVSSGKFEENGKESNYRKVPYSEVKKKDPLIRELDTVSFEITA